MKTAFLIAAAMVAGPVHAQTNTDATSSGYAPLQAISAAPAAGAILPANTEILLRMNQEITTQGQGWSEGDTFNMTVAHPVMLGGYVIIPQGTRAVGRISWLTSKGAFGKSGKMDVELEYLELGGQRVALDGTYRQEGEGNTVATVGGVILAGVFAGFITGRSARIPQGRELMATLESDVPVALPNGMTVAQGTQAIIVRQ